MTMILSYYHHLINNIFSYFLKYILPKLTMCNSVMVCLDFFFLMYVLCWKLLHTRWQNSTFLLLLQHWSGSVLQFPLVYHKQHHSVSLWGSVCLPAIREVAKGEKENRGWRQCKLRADVLQCCSKMCPTHPGQGEAPWAQAAVLCLQSSPLLGCHGSLESVHQEHVFSCS